MYVVKIGNDQVRVVDREDAKTLNNKLIDMNCDERVSMKKIINEDELKEDPDEV